MLSQPRFSIVSAVYDVGSYLPEFIASIEAQDFDLDRVEVVLVDDGSSDDSLAQALAWADRRPGLVRVLQQENAGQGAARNAGLRVATGEWITFTDPDDALAPDYLRVVDRFLDRHPETQLVATNRLLWKEETGEVTNTHPLYRFFSYDRLADLDTSETSFHGSAPAAFFRASVLQTESLEFDVRIRPNFEDGHFTARYLLHCPRPLVAFLGSARYHYRKRRNRTSSLQGSMLDERRYTDVFTHGYLAILHEARARRDGQVPLWLQHFLVYELAGYLGAYEYGTRQTISDGPVIDAFHANMAAVLGQLDLQRVVPYVEYTLSPQLALVLQHGYAEETWVQDQVLLDELDRDQRLARVRYYFQGDAPAEAVVNGEVVTGAVHAKTRALEYFGRTLLQERILWVRIGPDLRVRLNGAWAPLRFELPLRQSTRALPARIRRDAGSPSRRRRRQVERVTPSPKTPEARRARAAADRPRSAKRYADAWVLMDRIHDANDSAEVLFRRLRGFHPEVNAWFVIEKGTPDWRRLRKEFGRRVVAHGSLEWKVLMAHCTDLLSSHADIPTMQPTAITEFTEPRWRFTFLQHGVIKDDLSGWLRSKKIDLFVTSTEAETASILGDGSPYPFTTKEVRLTGLPRFDRLRETAERLAPQGRDLLLVAPTWRKWLVTELEDNQHRSLHEDAAGSEFVRTWVDLLADPALAELCRAHGLTLALLPHPNLPGLAPQLELPPHVRLLDYDGADVHEYFARTRVLVTDYSSIAFNAAYLDRPVVYYQFDGDRIRYGAHVGRRGYYSYETDGFGPVTADRAAAVAAIAAALEAGADPAPPYRARIAAAFPERDGQCCERVIAAVKAGRSRP